MKRFLISLNTLFVSTSFAVALAKETQGQTYKLATSENRFDDIFLKDEWQQPIQCDKTWHFLKSETNLNMPHNTI